MESSITLQQLIYIVAVDGRGSFVDAAEECRVSQPALSMQIRKLENTLGVKLFDRSRQPIVPTEIGRRVIAQARMALREAGRVQELVDLSQGEIKGEYRLGVDRSLLSTLLPTALHEFVLTHSEVILSVRELSNEQLAEQLRRDRIDAAIMMLPTGVDTFVERVLYHEPLVAYVPRTHRLYASEVITIEQLSRSDVILPSPGTSLRQKLLSILPEEMDEIEEEHRHIIEWEGGGVDSLRRLSEAGVGITLLPQLIADELRSGRTADMLRELDSPVPTRTVGIVYTSSHGKVHITEELELSLLAKLPNEMIQGRSL